MTLRARKRPGRRRNTGLFRSSGRPKIKRESLSKIQKRLWTLCKEITRARYGNTCFTCGAENLTGSNWHTGHMIPKSICPINLKYDLQNLRPQCGRCNLFLGGNGAEFLRRMTEIEGQEYVDELYARKREGSQGRPREYYESLIRTYTVVLNDLHSKIIGGTSCLNTK